jgi:hypothetical protein
MSSSNTNDRRHRIAANAWQAIDAATQHWRKHVKNGADVLAALINCFTQVLYVYAPHWGILESNTHVRRACFIKLLHRIIKNHHSLHVYIQNMVHATLSHPSI